MGSPATPYLQVVKGSFWDPYISRERLELETSNSAFRLTITGTNEVKLGQSGSGMGHVTYFYKFWDPVHISGTVGARNFKFGMQVNRQGY